MTITEGRVAELQIVMTSQDEPCHGRPGLAPGDVDCLVLRQGHTTWARKELTSATWRDHSHGVYTLTLEPKEFDGSASVTVLLQGHPGLAPPILSVLEKHEVVEARKSGIQPIPETILCGRVLTLAQTGKAKAAVVARVVQLPLVIGGAAITNDPVSTETNDDGDFELRLITGAVVNVQIQAINFQKQFAVPPPPAPGVPVRLFSI